MSPSSLYERVVKVAPEFAPVLAEHLVDNGELLPHVLMPRLLAFIGARLSVQSGAVDPATLDILRLLESEVTGNDAETQNVIVVSFLENLEAESFFNQLYPLLGPNLRAAHAPFAWQNGSDAG